jgi:hypothetical protein
MTLWVLVFVFGVAAVAGLVALKLLALRFTDDIDNEMRETARGMTAAMELFTDDELREITENPTLEDVIDSPQAVIVLDGDDIDLAVKAGTSDDPETLPVLSEYTIGDLRARAGEVFEMEGGDGIPDYRVLTAVLDDGRLLVVATALDDFERGLQTIGSVLLGVAIVGAVVMAVVVSFVTG